MHPVAVHSSTAAAAAAAVTIYSKYSKVFLAADVCRMNNANGKIETVSKGKNVVKLNDF